MAITISALNWAPGFAQGFVKDLRVRWALEEAASPYDVVLLDERDRAGEIYRAWQPFGQVPAYRDDDVEMFESGAIVLHIASKSEALAPGDAAGYAQVAAWVTAALNSIEPYVDNVVDLDLFYAGEAWTAGFRPHAEAALKGRLQTLSARLGSRDYLLDRFTAGDLMMTTVLRGLASADGMLEQFPTLDAYRLRCEARPAFGRALDGQMAGFREERSGTGSAKR